MSREKGLDAHHAADRRDTKAESQITLECLKAMSIEDTRASPVQVFFHINIRGPLAVQRCRKEPLVLISLGHFARLFAQIEGQHDEFIPRADAFVKLSRIKVSTPSDKPILVSSGKDVQAAVLMNSDSFLKLVRIQPSSSQNTWSQPILADRLRESLLQTRCDLNDLAHIRELNAQYKR